MALAAYKNEAVAKGLGPQGILTEADAVAVFKRLVNPAKTASSSSRRRASGPGRPGTGGDRDPEGIPARHAGGPALEDAVREAIARSGATKKDMGAS